MFMGRFAAVGTAACVSLSLFIAPFTAAADSYKKEKIANARFRSGTEAELLRKAYTVQEELGKSIYGQEPALRFLQTQLVQYFEGFRDRDGEPQAVNMIGLPGIGKSAIVEGLIKMGFPVVHLDAQKYAQDENSRFLADLSNRLSDLLEAQKPVILVIEEIDKVPETSAGAAEKSNPVIGALNQMLSSGRLSTGWSTLNVSNVMVITDMNISPEFISAFSQDVLKDEKNFFDYDQKDIETLDKWLRSEPSATYKILSKTFRNNTVGRLAPVSVVLSPLQSATYDRITRKMIGNAVASLTADDNAAKRVTVDFDESLIAFVSSKAVYPPSGARETVMRSKLIAEQLINFGIKSARSDGKVSDQPRHLRLAFDAETQEATVDVQTFKVLKGELVEDDRTSFRLAFDPLAKIFETPGDALALDKPTYKESGTSKRPVSQKRVFATRFPKVVIPVAGLKDALNSRVLGQEEAVDMLAEDVQRFAGQTNEVPGSPIFRVFSGFPGIGKSELIKQLAIELGLPLVKINLQQYSSESEETVRHFIKDVSLALNQAREQGNGHFVLLLEEMDKLFEMDPQTGRVVNRPVMSALKDLMNDGVVQTRDGSYSEHHRVDIRRDLTYVTMNFSIDRFGFSADPRLTSIEDVRRAWSSLKSTPMAMKELLGSMFLPDTVSRVMPRFAILRPVEEANYRRIILQQQAEVLRTRFFNAEGEDLGKIELKLSPAYRAYLYAETVVPSEGARNTAVASKALIATHLEETLRRIQRSSPFARQPLTVTLDFDPEARLVTGKVRLQSETKRKGEALLKLPVALNFPSLKKAGALSESRILTSAHEFGHAFVFARMGLRIDQVVVVSPMPGIGGYVKPLSGPHSAVEMAGSVYATVAARAFERIVLSEDPRAASSVLDITAGASSDIQQATLALYHMLYELGFDPEGGTLDRNFVKNGAVYASYQSLPSELAEKLGLILRDMESLMVEDALKAHSLEWYAEKIAVLGHEGAMDEQRFYELLGYPLPAAKGQMGHSASFFSNERLRRLFKDHLSAPADQRLQAMQTPRDEAGMSQEDYTRHVMDKFAEIVSRHLHGTQLPQPCEDLLDGPRTL